MRGDERAAATPGLCGRAPRTVPVSRDVGDRAAATRVRAGTATHLEEPPCLTMRNFGPTGRHPSPAARGLLFNDGIARKTGNHPGKSWQVGRSQRGLPLRLALKCYGATQLIMSVAAAATKRESGSIGQICVQTSRLLVVGAISTVVHINQLTKLTNDLSECRLLPESAGERILQTEENTMTMTELNKLNSAVQCERTDFLMLRSLSWLAFHNNGPKRARRAEVNVICPPAPDH